MRNSRLNSNAGPLIENNFPYTSAIENTNDRIPLTSEMKLTSLHRTFSIFLFSWFELKQVQYIVGSASIKWSHIYKSYVNFLRSNQYLKKLCEFFIIITWLYSVWFGLAVTLKTIIDVSCRNCIDWHDAQCMPNSWECS